MRAPNYKLPAVCDVLVTNVCNAACDFCGFARDKTLVGAARYLDADAFARATTGEAQSLIEALRKLTEKNLSNLTPHPLYSSFYYSHPTLLERERALQTAR